VIAGSGVRGLAGSKIVVSLFELRSEFAIARARKPPNPRALGTDYVFASSVATTTS
jgi:hypothetical protein